MKHLFNGMFIILSQLIMWLPFHSLRYVYLKISLKSLGRHTEVCRNVDIRTPRNIIIGNNTTINKRVLLDGRGGSLCIGDSVDIAQEVQIWTLQHDYNSPDYKAIGNPVIVKDYVWIGSRAIILPGIIIGKGAVIAAGSIVTKNVPDYTVVAGIPARKISCRNIDLNYKLGKWRWFQ